MSFESPNETPSVIQEGTKNAPTPKEKTRGQHIKDNVISFGFALFLVLVIRSSIIEAFKIPSGSMIPTLMIGDHIFVNKLAYDLHVPFTEYLLEKPVILWNRSKPQRGDVIVFKYPVDDSVHYIKRVIGVPGDKISVRDKIIYLNGAPLERVQIQNPGVIESLDDRDYDRSSIDLFDEVNPTTKEKHFVMLDRNTFFMENYSEVEVPKESYFVMGDNRDYSADSRKWGFVPEKNIRGKALFVWLSLWLDFTKERYYFRPGRTGTGIH